MSLADQSFTLTYFVGVCVGGGGEVFAHTFATVDKDARGQLAWVLCPASQFQSCYFHSLDHFQRYT